jgi:hypothetical protein
MTISIGIIHGDAVVASSNLGSDLRRIMRALDTKPTRNSELTVNIIFLTHGRLSQPLADGVTLHRHSQRSNSIIVHIGVPSDLRNAESYVPFLFSAMRESVKRVAERMVKKKIAYVPTRDLARIAALEANWSFGATNN